MKCVSVTGLKQKLISVTSGLVGCLSRFWLKSKKLDSAGLFFTFIGEGRLTSDPEMNSEIRVSQEVTNRSNLSLRSDGTRNVEISKAKMTKISEAFCCILPLYLNSTKSFYLFHCNGAVTVQRNLPGVSNYLKSAGNAELSDRIIWKIFFLHHPWVKK